MSTYGSHLLSPGGMDDIWRQTRETAGLLAGEDLLYLAQAQVQQGGTGVGVPGVAIRVDQIAAWWPAETAKKLRQPSDVLVGVIVPI